MQDFRISFVGDIMPGGVLAYQDRYYTDAIKEYLSEFDLRVATLEVAIGDNLSFDKVKMEGRQNIIYSKNKSIEKVVELDVNVVSLANNHIFDLGCEGFENTIKLLEENNIKYCGAGKNLKDASRPVVIEKDGKTITFLAYCDCDFPTIGYVPIATETSFGINPLNIDTVVADIKRYKKLYDYVVVLPHWGVEYYRFPTKKMKEYSRLMVDAGADLVVGSHAHIAQPSVKYKKTSIFFGLGNFLFPDFYMDAPRPMWYPTEDYDFQSIPITYGYPFPIERPMKRVWTFPSRIGLMVEAFFTNKVTAISKFSILTKDNVVDLYEDKRLKRKLIALSFIVSCPFYQGGRGLVMRIIKKISKLVGVVKSCL